MDKVKIAYSDKSSMEDAFNDIYNTLTEARKEPLTIIFSSDINSFKYYSEKLHASFPASNVVGATSYVTLSTQGYGMKCLCAMALYDGVMVSAGYLKDIARHPMKYSCNIEQALEPFPDYDNMICVEFTCSYKNCEEIVQDTYKSVLKDKNIPIFGGSAGTADNANSTYVSLNGTVYDEASVFLLIKNLNGRIGLFRENLFKPTTHFFTATDVDCDERAVYEYDNLPAAEVVANALSCRVDELNEQLLMHPVGRIDGDNIYIAEGSHVNDENGIVYFTRIYNRTKVVLLEVDDIDRVWNDTAQKIHAEYPNISYSLVINCFSRSKYFIENNRMDDYRDKLVKEYGTYLGFSGFGEQIDYEHLNQTMIIAVFE